MQAHTIPCLLSAVQYNRMVGHGMQQTPSLNQHVLQARQHGPLRPAALAPGLSYKVCIRYLIQHTQPAQPLQVLNPRSQKLKQLLIQLRPQLLLRISQRGIR